jgi:alpha-aminoadipic semialdehyde synthase
MFSGKILMSLYLGIRREDKNQWERRVPIIPKHVKELKQKHGIETIVQPSSIRVYPNESYEKIGAKVQDDLSKCKTIFAIKEIPIDFFEPKKTYIFFSHTIKGQKYNMSMLRKMMDLKCNLIDYEKIINSKGIRLLFFGRFAGIAGMVDTLWAYGRKLDSNNIISPINETKQTIDYENLDSIKDHLMKIGKNIQKNGLPKSISPIIIGIAGYGNVSKGVQEILDFLPIKNISPSDIKKILKKPSNKCLYKVVFKEEDMVAPVSSKNIFDLNDYYQNPIKYKSILERYVPDLTILMNCIYWDSRYPRLVTKEFIKKNFGNRWRLQIIGDISIDINGAIEFTEKATTPDNPVFIYNPFTDEIKDGFKEEGIIVMGVDNLPCELPLESSRSFSEVLNPFVPSILKADFNVEFEKIKLPPEIKRGVILCQGKLTKDFQYMDKYL